MLISQTYPRFYGIRHVHIVRNVNKADEAAAHEDRWQLHLLSLNHSNTPTKRVIGSMDDRGWMQLN